MKKKYVIPEMQIVELKEPLMLELPVSNTEVDRKSVASQEEAVAPDTPNLWGDFEEEE